MEPAADYVQFLLLRNADSSGLLHPRFKFSLPPH
jgi:hypothetical protein